MVSNHVKVLKTHRSYFSESCAQITPWLKKLPLGRSILKSINFEIQLLIFEILCGHWPQIYEYKM